MLPSGDFRSDRQQTKPIALPLAYVHGVNIISDHIDLQKWCLEIRSSKHKHIMHNHAFTVLRHIATVEHTILSQSFTLHPRLKIHVHVYTHDNPGINNAYHVNDHTYTHVA